MLAKMKLQGSDSTEQVPKGDPAARCSVSWHACFGHQQATLEASPVTLSACAAVPLACIFPPSGGSTCNLPCHFLCLLRSLCLHNASACHASCRELACLAASLVGAFTHKLAWIVTALVVQARGKGRQRQHSSKIAAQHHHQLQVRVLPHGI